MTPRGDPQYRCAMKITLEPAGAPVGTAADDAYRPAHSIRGYGVDGVRVGERTLRASVIVSPEQLVDDWRPASVDDLVAEDFEPVLALRPEVVLLGTGQRQRFPDHGVLARLHAARIGVEVMDTGAACRTYNVLLGEGRRVVAALLL
jgi:uncharacterized protein